ncbi:DUF362 iron-sulfur cluster-binding domain protein [Syntrophotalea carbinolica DSM 2380]|uniref:DUF362 iron-sulfur cluster-binding domain protein n=1 Tax=Syntrophotalea carbinolica (strain DSM 2380 / NBRC 103641 / GraBd1) TaxID=338963 RepID=Q3A6X8_SYNC1|nr:DUF362 domain-containing protein [Syntrophotalea carbinolica]ABA87879.1 DUF362 iron-sulfur cluster-binding domain protein [Syntrophotalea carbinolica DSM 2380]
MTLPVALAAAGDYQRDTVEQALARVMAELGGMNAFVRPGQKVLIKPNMLAGKSHDKAVTTHPEVVRAVIRMVQEAGGSVSVGDSPGVGTPAEVARRCGIMQVIEETGARFAPFVESVRVGPVGRTFRQLELARDILDADVIINIPKLKTHGMMGLTCGVKNLFGAVVGMRKPALHLQAGADKGLFALMLLELAEHIRPTLTIVDAIVGMEGNGPGSGDPITMGALLAGTNALAVDSVAINLVGMTAADVWTQRLAQQTQRYGSRLEDIALRGDALQDLALPRICAAHSADMVWGIPTWLQAPLQRALSSRPYADPQLCRHCGLCVKHCPPQAMVLKHGRLHIDYRRCIHCFCCQELCPYGALLTRQGWLLRLTRRLGERKRRHLSEQSPNDSGKDRGD